VRTMDEVMSQARAQPRFLTLALILFSGIALALAVVGIYGVISYAVARRTREFGLRMALGAQPENVLSLVLRGGLLLIAGGVAIGLAGSLAATRVLSGWLFGIRPTDPATFAAITKLKPGTTTEILPLLDAQTKKPAGYVIYKLISKEPAGQRDLSDPRVQQSIRQQLHDSRSQLLKNAYLEILQDEAKVRNFYAEEVFKETAK